MTTKTEAQKLAANLKGYVAHELDGGDLYDVEAAAALLLRQDAAIKVLREALKWRIKDAEQAAFEDWAERESPSGDVESVQYQWEHSGDYMDFCVALAWAKDALTATEGL